jgi:hypothetical protein
MAAFQPIELTIGSQSVVFDPARLNDSYSLWEDKTLPVYLAYRKFSADNKRPTGQAGTTRYRKPEFKTDVPFVVLDSQTGLYTLKYRIVGYTRFDIPLDATEEEIALVRQLHAGCMANTQVTSMIDSGENPY